MNGFTFNFHLGNKTYPIQRASRMRCTFDRRKPHFQPPGKKVILHVVSVCRNSTRVAARDLGVTWKGNNNCTYCIVHVYV